MSDPAKYRTRDEVQSVPRQFRSDRAMPSAAEKRSASARTRSKAIERISTPRWPRPPISPSNRPSPRPAELYTDVLVGQPSDADRTENARPFPDDGGRHARQVARQEGDTVKSGDILAEIETDKATMEFEAVDEGTIAQDPGRRGHETA